MNAKNCKGGGRMALVAERSQTKFQNLRRGQMEAIRGSTCRGAHTSASSAPAFKALSQLAPTHGAGQESQQLNGGKNDGVTV